MTGWKKINWLGWLAFGFLLLAWELGARATPKLQLYLPPVSQIFAAIGQALMAGPIAQHFGVTLGRFLEGYLLSAALAVTLGVVLGYVGFLRSLFETVIELMRPMPSVAIIPVAILLLGLGDSMIVAVTVYASVWPILINTIDGVRHIEPTLIDTGRTFGLKRRQILRQIILPGAAPYIVTGLRIIVVIVTPRDLSTPIMPRSSQ